MAFETQSPTEIAQHIKSLSPEKGIQLIKKIGASAIDKLNRAGVSFEDSKVQTAFDDEMILMDTEEPKQRKS